MLDLPDNRRISVIPENAGSRVVEARDVYAALVLAIGYFLGVYAGIALTFPSSPVSTLWPPNAILFAALLLAPRRHWWLMVAAVLPAHFAAELALGVPPAMAALWFVSNVAEALFGATVILKYLGTRPRFDRIRDLSVFLVAGVLLAPFLSSFLDASFVALIGWRSSDYWEVWRIRLFSNALAALVLVPLIVIWLQAGLKSLRQATFMQFSEVAVLLAGISLTSAAVFQGGLFSLEFRMYLYPPLLFFIWAAVRFGVRGVSVCAAIVAAFAIIGVLSGRGPFASSEPHSAVLTVQIFLIVAESSFLLLAASLTELRRAKAVAARQEESLSVALDAAEMGTWEWDFSEDLITWRSAQGAATKGESRSRSRSPARLLRLVHRHDRNVVLRAMETARQRGGSGEIECRFLGGSAGYRWITTKGRVQTDARGVPRQMIGVYIDSTHRKSEEMQARAQREQLAHLGRVSTLGELSGAIAHELNQPLTAILFNAQAALRELDSASADLYQIAQMLEDIVSQDRRAGNVIQRLRTLLLRGAVEMQAVNLNECIEEVLDLEQTDLVAHRVITEVTLENRMPAVIGDRVQLQQVLLNLVVNARDAMTEVDGGERKLRIVSAVDAGSVSVEICDTGIGIHDLEAIFEPFFSTKDHGIGMGLAICRKIITAHGGRLWASNNSTRGATFHMSVPIETSRIDASQAGHASMQ